MARLTPYAGTSHDRLSELVKVSQPSPLPDGVTFQFKNVLPLASGNFGDTQVTITPYLRGVAKPAQAAGYYRLSLYAVNELPEGSVLPMKDVVWPTTLHQLLPYINECLGVDLIAAEVVDYAIDDMPIRLTVTIKPQCLAWEPGDYYFSVENTLPDGIRITQDRAIRLTDNGSIRIVDPGTFD